MIPAKPVEDMEELYDEYAMVANVSNIQPFERLRDMQAFYAGEAARAIESKNRFYAQKAFAERRVKNRKAHLMDSNESKTRWRVMAAVESDSRIRELEEEILLCETSMKYLEDIGKSYSDFAFSLSREITARMGDRDRWQGRAGDR